MNGSSGLVSTYKLEWQQWWTGLRFRYAPLFLVLAYWGILYAVGGLRDDLVTSSLLPLIFYYLGPRFRPLFNFALPFFLVSIFYDSQRYYADLIRGPIHVREPYEWELKWFGINTPNGRQTPNEWWQLHTYPVLDFICGLAYIIFIPVFVSTSLYFRFILPRKGSRFSSSKAIALRSEELPWAFFWVNLIGWSTYYWYAASPPWYVALHGLGPARLDVPANLAGCARFDALLGMPIFANWYGRSADVHGAIPSLHVSYPLISFYYALRFGSLRILTLGFYLLMCFSAVYLNHHYILDVLVGSIYALAVAFVIDMYWNHRFKRKGIVV